MFFGFSGPRILGIRPYIGFTPKDFTRSRVSAAGNQEQGFIYVISGAHGRVKIGITSDPAARMASLRTASAFPLKFEFIGAVQNSAFAVEREAHMLLERNRVDGEWFDASPEMAIAAVWGAAGRRGDKVCALNERDATKVVAVVQQGDKPAGDVGLRIISYAIWMVWIALAILIVFCIAGAIEIISTSP